MYELKEERIKELLEMSETKLIGTKEYKEFISDNVYLCVSDEIDFILNSDDRYKPFFWDDVENSYTIDYEDLREDLLTDAEDEKEKELIKNMDEGELCRYAEDNGYNIEDYKDLQEIYEWWAVSYWLLYRLRERGEPVLDKKYWGRGTTGQRVEADKIIVDIFREYLRSLL